MKPHICICTAQVPFTRGGCESLVEALHAELSARDFDVEVVAVPFNWNSRVQVLKSALAWRLLDLTEVNGRKIDLVIATRFPSYLVKHPNKVVWLVHQFRQCYDLLGTPYSELSDDREDRKLVQMVKSMDERALSEARRLFTLSKTVADRLERFNGLRGTLLYAPPRAAPKQRGHMGHYILSVGRLDSLKRVDILLQAMQHTRTPARCVLAGTGAALDDLRSLARRLRILDRVRFEGWVDEARLDQLYSDALAVYYAPYDEDYGLVTIEAFGYGKPVLTASDSGGVLEFVEDGINGYVYRSGGVKELARRIDQLFGDRSLAAAMGAAGTEKVRQLSWSHVVSSLTGT